MSLTKVKKILVNQLTHINESDVRAGASLFDDLDMDGYEFDEFIATIEEEFEIEIDDPDSIEYVKDIVSMIKELSD